MPAELTVLLDGRGLIRHIQVERGNRPNWRALIGRPAWEAIAPASAEAEKIAAARCIVAGEAVQIRVPRSPEVAEYDGQLVDCRHYPVDAGGCDRRCCAVLVRLKTVPPGVAELTDAEREVLRLVGNGKSLAEVAHLRGCTTSGVRTHLSSARKKLHLKDSTQVVALAGRCADIL